MAKSDKSLTWLGKYLSLALTLPASVVAGYILGTALDHWLQLPILRVVGIVLGMVGGLLQIFRELDRDSKREQRERK
jgi:F0F1-type ATP synthase assembly protein I